MSNTGTVKRYDRKRGFGFISPSDGGEDLFCHWQAITSDDKWPCLKMGMEVTFDTTTDERKGKGKGKTVAANVCDADGAPISVEEVDREISDETWTGTVKMFAKKGFGFITSDSEIEFGDKTLPAKSDVYVSREDLLCEEGSVSGLRVGMKVQFKVCKFEREANGIAAAEVCNEDGSPLSVQPLTPEEKAELIEKFGKGKGKGKSKDKGKIAGKTTFSSYAKGASKGVGKTTLSSFGKGVSKGVGKGSTIGKGVAVPQIRAPIRISTPVGKGNTIGKGGTIRLASSPGKGVIGKGSTPTPMRTVIKPALKIPTLAGSAAWGKGAAKGAAKGWSASLGGAAKGVAAKGATKGKGWGKW